MSWKRKVPFADLYEIPSKNGLTKPSKVRGQGFKMINMGELFANDRIYDISMELVPLTETEKAKNKIEVGDLLFARQSLVLSGAGKCSIVMDVSPLTVFESHLIRVRLDKTKANPMFYFYYFASPISPIKSIISQGVQAGIRASDLAGLVVDWPDIDTQNRIAGILSKYDDLIENNQKQIRLLEEVAERLYKEWFVNLRFPGYEECEVVEDTPVGWSKVGFFDEFDYVRGKSYTSKDLAEDGGVLMVNLKNIKAWGGYKRNVEKHYIGSYKDNQLLQAGDIVMAVTDMTQERRLVGHCARVPKFCEKIVFSMDLIKLIPLNISSDFAYSILRYDKYGKSISLLANGVNVLHLKPDALRQIES